MTIKDDIIPLIKFKGKKLTSRQIEILDLIGSGLSNAEISETLFLSKKTVESHLTNLRSIISKKQNEFINDRRLVLLAKEMKDAYEQLVSSESEEFFCEQISSLKVA